jgi:hypothetical protein
MKGSWKKAIMFLITIRISMQLQWHSGCIVIFRLEALTHIVGLASAFKVAGKEDVLAGVPLR